MPSNTPQPKPGDRARLLRFEYDRSACSPGVLHVGVGAFHRAHQAVYFDRLLHQTGMQDWGIIGINLRAQDHALIKGLAAQDHRYVLKTISPQGENTYREIGSILDTADASLNMEAAASLATNPNLAIISMTVTESGYYLREDGSLERDAKDVTKGLENATGHCIYTFLHQALKQRHKANAGPITLLNCDNLRGNGHKLRHGLRQYLLAADEPSLIEWIEENVSFPCSMVDRITPRPDPSTAAEIRQQFGVNDQLSVTAESYIQWVIEDHFAGRRPPLEQVGAQMVADVEPYEDAKIRILNAGHSVTAYLGALKGYTEYDQAFADAEITALFDQFEHQESIPALGESPVSLDEYTALIRERFSNPYISDAVARICMDGASKIPTFVLPSILGSYQRGHRPQAALHCIASWYVFMRHIQTGSLTMEYIEPQWDWLQPLLAKGQETAFANHSMLWGELPKQHAEFVPQAIDAIAAMQTRFPLRTADQAHV